MASELSLSLENLDEDTDQDDLLPLESVPEEDYNRNSSTQNSGERSGKSFHRTSAERKDSPSRFPRNKSAKLPEMTRETTKFHHQLRWVFPTAKKKMTQTNLHRDVIKGGLQPNVINESEDYVYAARRILYRKRSAAKLLPRFSCRAKSANYASLMTQVLQDAKPDQIDVDHVSQTLKTSQAYQVPMFPGRRYTAEDVDRITERLATFDPEKIPESRGYPIKLDVPVVYRKNNYTEDQIYDIVKRLSTYDPEKSPPESRPPGGAPHMIRAPSRQTLGPGHVKRCSSAQVQEIVNRLSRYDPWKWPPGSRNSRCVESRA